MTKVINLRKRYKTNIKSVSKKSIRKQKNTSIRSAELYKTIFTIIAVASILTGCLAYRYNPVNEISNYCETILSAFLSSSYLSIILLFLKFDLINYLLIFFIGTSIIGAPLTFTPLFLKSIYIGYFSSYMYCEYELKGVLFCLILVYPFFIITTTSLIYASNESAYMCKYIYNTLTNKNTADNISIRLYLIRYLFLIGINMACIIINSLLVVLLADKFTLL